MTAPTVLPCSSAGGGGGGVVFTAASVTAASVTAASASDGGDLALSAAKGRAGMGNSARGKRLSSSAALLFPSAPSTATSSAPREAPECVSLAGWELGLELSTGPAFFSSPRSSSSSSSSFPCASPEKKAAWSMGWRRKFAANVFMEERECLRGWASRAPALMALEGWKRDTVPLLVEAAAAASAGKGASA